MRVMKILKIIFFNTKNLVISKFICNFATSNNDTYKFFEIVKNSVETALVKV